MKVSIVVPTWNSARTLSACLKSIRAQTHRDIELLVVDANSHDETPRIAETLSDAVLMAGAERSAQRNRGAEIAQGSGLLFVDSDMILDRAVVAECVEAAATGADSVVIPEESFGEGFWARCKALERSCYVGDAMIEAARFFTREIFERLGGFDETLVGGEDWDLHERAGRAGARVSRTVACIRHDEGRLELRGLMAKKFRYGKTLGRYRRKHPVLARSQFRVVRPAFVRHRRRLLRSPLITSGIVVMKTAEAAAGIAGLVAAAVQRRP